MIPASKYFSRSLRHCKGKFCQEVFVKNEDLYLLSSMLNTKWTEVEDLHRSTRIKWTEVEDLH